MAIANVLFLKKVESDLVSSSVVIGNAFFLKEQLQPLLVSWLKAE